MMNNIFKKGIVFGVIVFFIGASIIPSFNVKGVESNNTAEWFEDFNDGDISDWTIENPDSTEFPGTKPITLEVSNAQWYSFSYSLLIHSPATYGYSAIGFGPKLLINFAEPYIIDFWFRWNDFHWGGFCGFGHVRATIDYPDNQIIFCDDIGYHHVGPSFQSYCSPNTWTHFQFSVDPAFSSFTMVVDGNTILTFTYDYSTPETLTQFRFYDGDNGVDFFDHGYYDDILIVYVPRTSVIALVFGKITNLSSQGDIIQFEAVKTRVFTLKPLSFNTYQSGEKFSLNMGEYKGFIGLNYIFSLCKMYI